MRIGQIHFPKKNYKPWPGPLHVKLSGKRLTRVFKKPLGGRLGLMRGGTEATAIRKPIPLNWILLMLGYLQSFLASGPSGADP